MHYDNVSMLLIVTFCFCIQTDGIPESVRVYFEAARDRMSVFEKHLQEDQEEKSKTWF